ncbi:MAG: hypothetical protein K6G10_01500 [Butyrivibrio sp.]|nr:hypothetical protein [Butyrivibrio sp.]
MYSMYRNGTRSACFSDFSDMLIKVMSLTEHAMSAREKAYALSKSSFEFVTDGIRYKVVRD